MTLEENKAQLDALLEGYKKSKMRRVAAIYCDTPHHLRHQVHHMFGIAKELPRQYYVISNRIKKSCLTSHP